MASSSAQDLHKAATALSEEERQRIAAALSSVATPFEQPLSIAAAEEDREAFVVFIKRATTDRSSHEYNELYQFLLMCFTLADNDFDARSD